jgi:hypothetical protein
MKTLDQIINSLSPERRAKIALRAHELIVEELTRRVQGD